MNVIAYLASSAAGVCITIAGMEFSEFFAMILCITYFGNMTIAIYVLFLHELICFWISKLFCRNKTGCTNKKCFWRSHCSRPLGRIEH